MEELHDAKISQKDETIRSLRNNIEVKRNVVIDLEDKISTLSKSQQNTETKDEYDLLGFSKSFSIQRHLTKGHIATTLLSTKIAND